MGPLDRQPHRGSAKLDEGPLHTVAHSMRAEDPAPLRTPHLTVSYLNPSVTKKETQDRPPAQCHAVTEAESGLKASLSQPPGSQPEEEEQ